MHGSRSDALRRTLAVSSRRQILRTTTTRVIGGLFLPLGVGREWTRAAPLADLTCGDLCNYASSAIGAGGQAACASIVEGELCGPGALYCTATAAAICSLTQMMPGLP